MATCENNNNGVKITFSLKTLVAWTAIASVISAGSVAWAMTRSDVDYNRITIEQIMADRKENYKRYASVDSMNALNRRLDDICAHLDKIETKLDKHMDKK